MSDTPTRREPEATRTITCVWCGYACPAGTPTAHDQRLREHVKVCPKHPLANVIRACELAESIDRENGVTMIGHPDKGRGQMWASDVLKLAFGDDGRGVWRESAAHSNESERGHRRDHGPRSRAQRRSR